MSHTTLSNRYATLADKLRDSSLRHSFDTFNRLGFQEKLSRDKFQFPEEFISLYHHPIYKELSDKQRWDLSLLEAVHFFSINIYGEQALVSEMEERLYRNKRVGECFASSRYMQHFIHEENSHTFMLSEFCHRYHGKLFQNRKMAVEQNKFSACASDLLFYGRTFVLESFLGFVNRRAQTDANLDQTAKEIHHCHLVDEVRHMAWDRAMIEGNLELLNVEGLEEELAEVKRLIEIYIKYNFRMMYNHHIYNMIGLDETLGLAREASQMPQRQAFEQEWTKEIRRHFRKMDMNFQ